MALCTIQEIQPLNKLREDLDLSEVCLDHTDERIHFKIGYCQGLLSQLPNSTPSQHTEYLSKIFSQIGLPMPKSHELFVGLNKQQLPLKQYIQEAAKPLLANGAVPVIITQYDPARDMQKLEEIFTSPFPFAKDQTVLVRMQLSSDSINATAKVLRKLYAECVKKNTMPKYWPLIQADGFTESQWNKLKEATGTIWRYAVVAATPYTAQNTPEFIKENIAVMQIFVGSVNGIDEKGTIELEREGCVGNALKQSSYNLIDYAKNMSALQSPVAIVCGQAQQEWSEAQNIARLEKINSFLPSVAKIVWKRNLQEVMLLQKKTALPSQ